MDWKIALPAQPTVAAAAQPTAVRIAKTSLESAAHALSDRLAPWFDRDYLSTLSETDLTVLSNTFSRLAKTRVGNVDLVRSVNSPAAIPRAEEAVSEWNGRRAERESRRNKDSALMTNFSLDPSKPPSENVRIASELAGRYSAIASQVGCIEKALRECDILGDPSLADILFLSDILPSLMACDVELIAAHPHTPSEIAMAREALALMAETASATKLECGFDPSAHAVETLSGIRRAIVTRKATDFVTAFSMFGTAFANSDKAQKASGLMKKYLTACDQFAVASGETPKQRRAMNARIDLDSSIARRAAILADSRIAPALLDLAKGTHVARLAALADGLGPDARRIVEDNLVGAHPAPAEGLVEHLSKVGSELLEWAQVTAHVVSAVGGEPSNHLELNQTLDALAGDLATLGSYRISSAADVDEVQKHVAWLREATLLPVSDEALETLFRRLSETPLPPDL